MDVTLFHAIQTLHAKISETGINVIVILVMRLMEKCLKLMEKFVQKYQLWTNARMLHKITATLMPPVQDTNDKVFDGTRIYIIN